MPSAYRYRTYKSQHTLSSRVSDTVSGTGCALALNIGLVAVFRSLQCSGQVRDNLIEKVGQLALTN